MSEFESLVADMLRDKMDMLFNKAYAKAYKNASSELSAGEDWCIYNGLVSAMSVVKEFLLGDSDSDSTDENKDETIADGE